MNAAEMHRGKGVKCHGPMKHNEGRWAWNVPNMEVITLATMRLRLNDSGFGQAWLEHYVTVTRHTPSGSNSRSMTRRRVLSCPLSIQQPLTSITTGCEQDTRSPRLVTT